MIEFASGSVVILLMMSFHFEGYLNSLAKIYNIFRLFWWKRKKDRTGHGMVEANSRNWYERNRNRN